jgi:glycerol-3-phosphate dehydrogenase
MLGAKTVRAMLPTVVSDKLAGGVEYFDGQFDDARFSLALAQTLDALGGTALNYTRMVRLLKSGNQQNGKIIGAVLRDEETGNEFEVQATVIINATGVFTDDIRRLDEAATKPIVTFSQGSHLVLPKSFLPGTNALMVPKTKDGRVLFAIPWHNHVVIGTTDDGVPTAALEPRPMEVELAFLREHIEIYFGRAPKDDEVLSMWSGLRPLVRKQGTDSTAKLSREHTVLVSASGLVSITGGKWTTYRRMAQDAVDIAIKHSGLKPSPCRTQDLHLHGWSEEAAAHHDAEHELHVYGSDQPAIDALAASSPALAAPLHPRLPYRLAEVVWAARHEMARTIDDVLARRTRALFLDARAALEAAPTVAATLATELGHNEAWQQAQLTTFTTLANGYVYHP